MNLFIDNKSGAPIYEQLYTQIKNQILSGELQPEEAMPSIRGLFVRRARQRFFCGGEEH